MANESNDPKRRATRAAVTRTNPERRTMTVDVTYENPGTRRMAIAPITVEPISPPVVLTVAGDRELPEELPPEPDEIEWLKHLRALVRNSLPRTRKKLVYPDTPWLQQVFDRCRSEAPTLARFDPAFVYSVPSTVRTLPIPVWKSEHQGRRVVAAICHPRGECVHLIDFEIGGVRETGEVTVLVHQMVSALTTQKLSEVRIVFTGEEHPLELVFAGNVMTYKKRVGRMAQPDSELSQTRGNSARLAAVHRVRRDDSRSPCTLC